MTATKREVWEWLQKNGPIKRPETIAEALDDDIDNIRLCLRKLKSSGHISYTVDRRYRANDIKELYPVTSPFGAGAGPTEGEKPEDKPPAL